LKRGRGDHSDRPRELLAGRKVLKERKQDSAYYLIQCLADRSEKKTTKLRNRQDEKKGKRELF